MTVDTQNNDYDSGRDAGLWQQWTGMTFNIWGNNKNVSGDVV